MRPLLVPLVLLMPLLAACTEATATRVDQRTFKIQGPEMAIAADGPNRRLANRICPKGFRVVDSESHKGGADRATDCAGRRGAGIRSGLDRVVLVRERGCREPRNEQSDYQGFRHLRLLVLFQKKAAGPQRRDHRQQPKSRLVPAGSTSEVLTEL